jgi:hypothetical protein
MLSIGFAKKKYYSLLPRGKRVAFFYLPQGKSYLEHYFEYSEL